MEENRAVILQVLPKLESGGVERGTIEITDAIKKAGMKPIVASGGGGLVPHVLHAGGEHITLPLYRKNPFVIYANARRLAKLIRTKNVSLIHARSRAPAWAAYLAAKWTGIPLVTTFHGVYSITSNWKKRYNSVMVKGARVIAISQFVQEHIVANYGTDPAKIRLIHRGVDLSSFGQKHIIPERIALVSKQWRLPDEHVPIIFCPGRITPIKGLHVLVEALERMRGDDFLCIIAGKDEGHHEYRADLEKQIIDAKLEGKVRMVDATPYMNEAYQLSHVVVIPSVKPEGFGRIAVEAQAVGRCVVATDHGGVQETIIPNETGYLVPVNDARAMAEAIHFALNRDEATEKAMGDFAKRHVRQHFSADQMKERTIAVYTEVLEERHSRESGNLNPNEEKIPDVAA